MLTPSSEAGMIDPISLVRQYVKRDGDGERLFSESWFQDVVTWPHEPGYDSFTVVRKYTVERPRDIQGSPAKVPVRYECIGWVVPAQDHPVFIEGDRIEVFTYVAVRGEGGWKIDAPQIDQHILAEVAASRENMTPEDAARIRELASESPAEQ